MNSLKGNTHYLKTSLILLTIVSVVCDTMILPFYPEFFSRTFGINSTEHVGYYIAACCFTVMVTFPLWARIAKRVFELHLWVITQFISLCFGLLSYYSTNIVEFWIFSQLMLVFKASYLLIYPFVMRLEEEDKHLGIVGLFAVLMHFGGIAGAILGGVILKYIDPKDIYLVMVAGDALQVVLCLFLIKKYGFKWRIQDNTLNSENNAKANLSWNNYWNSKKVAIKVFVTSDVFRICLVSLIFYCSAFLIRPFFTQYWEDISSINDKVITSIVFSLPAIMALFGLYYNKKIKASSSFDVGILSAFVICVCGLWLQAAQQEVLVLLGRCIYGFGMFQLTVKLEVLMFKTSSPENYAKDFSLLHLYQNIGVLLASFMIGHLVVSLASHWIFVLSSLGFLLSMAIFSWLLQESKCDALTTENLSN